MAVINEPLLTPQEYPRLGLINHYDALPLLIKGIVFYLVLTIFPLAIFCHPPDHYLFHLDCSQGFCISQMSIALKKGMQ